MIADDRPENILALSSILSEPEFEIVAAQSGSDALRCLLRQEFALLLLDVMMPGMDGFELASVIKENERHRSTPIIFLTAMATDVNFVYKGYSFGAVDSAFIPYIFDRFRQADGSITRKHGGLGLGMAIARHLVELHGGQIYVESEGEGKGSKFRVILPDLQDSPVSLAKQHKLALERSTVPEPIMLQAETLHGIKVLVVDDEADNRLLVSKILKKAGAEVRGAASAREAFEEMARSCPDVLLSDIGLPGEDGYIFIRKLKAMKDLQMSRIPAAALTAYAREEEKVQALAAGFEMHLTKPVSAGALLKAVSSLASKSRHFDLY